MSGLHQNLYSDRVYSRVQRSSGRHSSTRDHLVSESLCELGGGERVVFVMGLGSGSIDSRPMHSIVAKRLSRGANCIWSCSLCPRCRHDMMAVAHTAVSVLMMCLFVGLGPCVLGWVQLSVLTGCRLVHQLHVCLWQWSTQSLVHVPKWSEAELTLPRSSPVSAV